MQVAYEKINSIYYLNILYTSICELGDTYIVFDNFTASIGDLMVAN
jgi:hypothetical protein